MISELPKKGVVKQWIFHFVILCLASLLITTISSLFPSNPLLSTIHGQVPDQHITSPATITLPDDTTTSPVIIVPDEITEEAPSADGAQVTYTVTVEDDVDGTATLGENVNHIQDDVGGDIAIFCNPASGSVFSIGDTTVQCSATDAAGNEGTAASFTVTVYFPDTTPPIIIMPDDITKETTSSNG